MGILIHDGHIANSGSARFTCHQMYIVPDPDDTGIITTMECTCILVSENVVLTSAHCFLGGRPGSMFTEADLTKK